MMKSADATRETGLMMSKGQPDMKWSDSMRPAKNSGSVYGIQFMNAKTRHHWLLLAGWLVILMFCLTTSAWAAEMTTNGTFTGNTDWTPGGASPLTYDAGTGAGSFIQAVAGVKNANVSGSIAQNVNIPIGATVTAVTIDAMHTITQGAPTDEIIIEIFTGGAYVEIFRGTNVGTSFAPVTDVSGALPYVLIANASEVRITATITGTNVKATENLWIDDVSINYTSVDADNMLVSTSVPIATTAQPGLADVQALRLSLNTAGDGAGAEETVLSTLTIDDLFLEGEIDHIENLKIYIDDNNVYVDGTLGGVVTAGWDGTSTILDFAVEPSLTLAERTITAGTPKYLWVVLDVHLANTNYSARPSITAITVEGTDLPPSGGPWSANIIGVTAGLGCGQCHPNPMEDDALNQREPSTGGVAGSHTKHAIALGYDCDLCHNIKPIAPRHRNAYIGIVDPIAGQTNADYTTVGKAGVRQFGAYKDFPEVPDPVRGNCQNTLCHGGDTTVGDLGGPAGAGPQWGQRNDTDECTFCHNASKTNAGGLTNAYPDTDSPFRSDAAATAHNLHMTSTLTAVTCDDCHTIYATITEGGHIDTGIDAPADVPFPVGSAARLNTSSPSYDGAYVCSNVYCHGAKMPKGEDGGSFLAPDWDTDDWANFPANCTTACHDLPPKSGSSSSNGQHGGVAVGDVTKCSGCHGDTVTSTGNPPTMDPAFHINGTVEASGCTGCHGTDPNEYPPVAAWGTPATANGIGAHVVHIENTSGIMSKEVIGGEADLAGYWCAECHTTARGGASHEDGYPTVGGYPADIDFSNAVESAYGSVTEAFTAEGDADPDSGVGGSCATYCHGGSVDGSNMTPSWGDDWTNYADGGAGSCTDNCHGLPPSTATHNTYTYPADCETCHSGTVSGTTDPLTIDATLHINGAIEAAGGSCSDCHDGSQGPDADDARRISLGGSHMKITVGGADQDCSVCHPMHSGGVLVENNTAVGINYTTAGRTGFRLLAPNSETSEAEICWNCHDQNDDGDLNNAGDISEWSANTWANTGNSSYNYGTLGQLSWIGATWTSANFGYKTNTIASTHSANSSGATEGVDAVEDIRCSYCHDVHDLDKATGDTLAGKPYLRGGWMGNPYNEDGAPQSGTTFDSGTWGAVPRANINIDGSESGAVMGGYWIDQNSGDPAAAYTTTQNGGLCDLCHGQTKDGNMQTADIDALNYYGAVGTGWVSGNNGHSNSVKGGTGADGGDIFAGRGGTTTLGPDPYMGHDGMPTPGDQAKDDPFYGLRGADFGYALLPNTATGQIKLWDDDVWGVAARNQQGSVTENFHTFSCSKCHNPHASRLPKLMITNCLDTKHNTWDNDYQLLNISGSINLDRSISNWSSAQNCHRLGGVAGNGNDGYDSRGDVAAPEGGWNTVTPWD